MKISRNWLSDYLDLDGVSATELEELVTTRVAEVDEVERIALPVDTACVACVLEKSPHPERSELSVLKLGVGDEPRQVVCGAKNVEVGQFVAYQAPGGQLYSQKTNELLNIELREVAGVWSQGVLPSELELGLSSEHEGVLVIASDQGQFPKAIDKPRPGQPLSVWTGTSDVVLEIDNKSLTHRADLWCHFGFALELSAILGRELKFNPGTWIDEHGQGKDFLAELGSNGENPFEIRIAPETKARRFMAILIENLAPLPSPLWLRRRLYTMGSTVRNQLVDLSNYCMFDVGQPNHTYDKARLEGHRIDVRMATSGERFTGLDGVERELLSEDVVIADREGAIALGGVMGGNRTSVSGSTESILLESACFDPVAIRMTSKRCQLRTDASNRFEKDRSPFAAPLALGRYAQLLCGLQGSARIRGGVSQSFPIVPERRVIQVSSSYVASRLNGAVDRTRITSILKSLGFGLNENAVCDADLFEVSVPAERAMRDISHSDDIVEEIGRIHGYENIPEIAPLVASTASAKSSLSKMEDRLRQFLAGSGATEVYCYSFVPDKDLELFGYEASDLLELANPIDAAQRYMRPSLAPGMLRVLEKNARLLSEALFFEVGRSYSVLGVDNENNDSDSNVYDRLRSREFRQLAVAGVVPESHDRSAGINCVPEIPLGALFYESQALVKRLLALLGFSSCCFERLSPEVCVIDGLDFRFAYHKWMHPYRAAKVLVKGKVIGVISEVKPGLLDVGSKRAFLAEFDLRRLQELSQDAPRFKTFSKYPESFFEMSVVVPQCLEFVQLKKLVESSVPSDRLRDLDVIAVYRGMPLADDEKSVSLRCTFTSDEGTLASEELKALQDKVISCVEGGGYKLRS